MWWVQSSAALLKKSVCWLPKWVVGEQPAGKNTLGIRRGQCGNATHNAGNDLVDE